MHLALEIPGLEASLIDRTPEEVLVLTVSSLRLAATSGSNPTGPYRALRLSVQRLQLDDQLPGTRFPVVLAPVLGSDSPLPMLGVTFVSQVGARGRSFFPIIALRWPHAVQVRSAAGGWALPPPDGDLLSCFDLSCSSTFTSMQSWDFCRLR